MSRYSHEYLLIAGISEKSLPLVHQEVLDDRAQRERREERQRADDHDRADQQPDEQRAVRRERAAGRPGLFFLAARLPATASSGMMNRKRPISIARPSVRLYQGVLRVMPAKALPLLPVPLV